uniref:BTB domain-containing protein n=1 Tax=Panagrellus redivivus TaxID=6233 RepID=A0A7E4VHW2_PANRE
MSRFQNSETADILKKIGDLYLNEEYSDVVFVVEGENIPAHRNILGQRCSIFKAMFQTNSELQKQVIQLPGTILYAFKTLLKFIYTGDAAELYTITLDDLFDVLSVAKTYEMQQLEELCMAHLESDCAVDNVHFIIQEGIETSHETLLELGLDYVSDNFAKFVEHKAFIDLSAEGLQRVLEKMISEVSDDTVLRALVKWMKANTSNSEHFPKLLKQMDLKTIGINEIVATLRPLNLVDANVLLDLVCQHAKKDNDDDVDVGTSSTFVNPEKDTIMKHVIGSGNKSITIDFERTFTINYMEMELSEGDWSYWVEVSKDNVNWTCIIDYSKYICRSLQRLYFKSHVFRYIRIHGTAPANGTFEISGFDAYFHEKPLEVDPETNIVIPTPNVASIQNNAIIIQNLTDKMPRERIDTSDGPRYHYLDESTVLQLPQPYLIDSMNIMLNSECMYDYNIEVSTDKINWTWVFGEQNVTSWRHVRFDKQPVVFIKLTTSYIGSHPLHFTCQNFVCPAIDA